MPKVVNHDERRREIAKAAARVIAGLGIDRVKMSDVAQAAGCTVGALPHYFPGKDEILIAALRSVHESVRNRATKRAVETRFDPIEVWLSVLPTTKEARDEWRVWLAFSGRAVFDDALAEEFRLRYAQAHEDTRLILRSLISMGALPSTLELEPACANVLATMDGLGMRATIEPKSFPLARLRTQLEAFLSALGYRAKNATGA